MQVQKPLFISFAPITDESINNISSDYAVNGLFPNPANSSFNFYSIRIEKGNIKAQLTGRTGNVLLEKTFTMNEGINRYSMEVSKIPNGVYYLVVSNGAGLKVAQQQ
jgi:hypothetical protein